MTKRWLAKARPGALVLPLVLLASASSGQQADVERDEATQTLRLMLIELRQLRQAAERTAEAAERTAQATQRAAEATERAAQASERAAQASERTSLTVEGTALTGARVQIALERLGLQHEEVRALADQVSQLEASAEGSAAELDHLGAELALVEERLDAEIDPSARQVFGEKRRALEAAVRRGTAQDERTRERASEASVRLSRERSRLDTLLRSLEEFERALAEQERRLASAGTGRAAPGR